MPHSVRGLSIEMDIAQLVEVRKGNHLRGSSEVSVTAGVRAFRRTRPEESPATVCTAGRSRTRDRSGVGSHGSLRSEPLPNHLVMALLERAVEWHPLGRLLCHLRSALNSTCPDA